MKSKFLKLALLIVAVLTMTFLLAACDTEIDVATEFSVDGNFSGERIMRTEGIKKSDLGGGNIAENILNDIKSSAPGDLKVSYTESDGKYFITFSIPFSSLSDYENKVEAILGNNADITYSTADTAFSSSVNFQESFSTRDLLDWIQDVIRKYDKKATLSIKYTETDFILDSQEYKSDVDGRFSVYSTGSNTLISSINIDTFVLGLDNYSRAVTFRMSQEVYDTITVDKFDALVPENAAGKSYVDSEADKNNQYVYQITYSGTAADITAATSELFPNSTFDCSGSTTTSAFSVESVVSEKINFSNFPCNSNGTSNATLTYSSSYQEETEQDAPQLSNSVIFHPDNVIVEGDNVSSSKNSESKITVNCKGSSGASAAIAVKFIYGIQEITVDTTLSNKDDLKVSVLLDYNINASSMALELAENFFTEQFKSIEGVSLSSQSMKNDSDPSAEEFYQLKITFNGRSEKVCSAMKDVFGGENSFTNIYNNKFELSSKHNITHRVDITKLLEYANYSGVVNYVFRSESATCKGVDCQLYKDGVADGTPKNNLLNGKTKIGVFSVPVNGGSFKITFQSTYLNVGYIVFIVFIIIVAVIISTIFISLVARKSKAHKQVEKEIFKKAAVERSLALAVIQNSDGSIVPLSSQALANRPGAVVESRRDDGLDEDDDESETIWLFSTTLKLLSIIAAVLFFFPFISVSCSNTSGTQAISAFNLMVGFTRNDYTMNPRPIIALLLVIPLLIFMLLFLWNKLPKFPSAIIIIAASAACLLLLLNLEAIIEEQIDSMMELTNSSGAITSFKMEWAYSYSLITYMLLLIGSVVLLLAEISDKVRKKFK